MEPLLCVAAKGVSVSEFENSRLWFGYTDVGYAFCVKPLGLARSERQQ